MDNWLEFQNAIRSVSTKEKAKEICQIIYLSLNFVSKFREHIAKAVLASCNYKILEENNEEDELLSLKKMKNGKRQRKKRSFVYKLISQMTTDLRKSINRMSLSSNGIQYRKLIPEGEVQARSTDKKSHLRFYEWMIVGEYVSFICDVNSVVCLTSSTTHIYCFV